jgi:hypothetical protein
LEESSVDVSFLAPIIGGVGSILGGILGSGAAKDAAAAQAGASGQAANNAANQGAASNTYQKQIAGQQTGLLSPYATAGQGAVSNLSQLLQPGGQLTQGYGDFTAPTGVTEQNDPGYQFRLSQGLSALQNSAASRGGLLSTGTAKNINDYAQNSASNEYGNVYNRALGTYQTNQQNFNTNNNNLYSRLSGLSGQGLQAGSSLGGMLQSGASNVAGINANEAQQYGSAIQNQGAATASGYIGSANAWQGALGGAVNNLGGYLSDKFPVGGQG